MDKKYITLSIHQAIDLGLYKGNKDKIMYGCLDVSLYEFVQALFNNDLNSLKDDLDQAYEYLSRYRSSWLDEDSIKRINEYSEKEGDIKSINIGKAIYDVISQGDNSDEYEAGYIAGLLQCINLINNKK